MSGIRNRCENGRRGESEVKEKVRRLLRERVGVGVRWWLGAGGGGTEQCGQK
jgi:hypothetical protein